MHCDPLFYLFKLFFDLLGLKTFETDCMMLNGFYNSFSLERERLQLPKLHRCGYFALRVRKHLAVSRWVENACATDSIPEPGPDGDKSRSAPRNKVNIGACGAVAQALYRYLDAKYRFNTQSKVKNL